ncbi:MAG: tetratricopeptide repeat protein [Bacteroidetes bacterium]|nr:MAG: tetratricopeptide repeat protein [Bacteroidota bacterium]
MVCNKIKTGALRRSRFFLISAFVFLSGSLFSQYIFNERCREAYQEILNFDFQDASNLLKQEAFLHLDNLIPIYLANYIDFFKLLTGEDKVMFATLKSNKAIRINQLEEGDKHSPYYRFCIAGITLQWAFVRLKFGEYTTAAFEIRRAYTLLKENEKLFPDFLPNQVGLGILHIIVGLIPDQYRWLANLAGLDGTIQQGVSELKQVLNYSGGNPDFTLYKPEVCFYLAFIDINLLNDKEESVYLIRRFDRDSTLQRFGKSPLIIYAKASIFMKNGKNEEVIQLLHSYSPPEGAYPFAFLSYLEGLARLDRLDTSAAIYLRIFIDQFKGINYIKSGYQKLAWVYLLQGDTLGYRQSIELAGKKGNAIVDEDKQAHSEYNIGIMPAIPLLKARLLYDGGYYKEALEILLNTSLGSYFRSKKDLAEYTYRLGRIYHALGNLPKAIQYYSMTITNGRNLPYYYAANAALNLGWIYEEQGNDIAADTNFRLCISMDYDEYQNSLRPKAKAGLSRIKEKD